jgi:hypothetical protein
MSKSEAKAATVAPIKRKKLTVDKIDLAKEPAGFKFEGVYRGETLSAPFNDVDKKTGEIVQKTLTFAMFDYTDGREGGFKVIADAGLQAALRDAMIEKGAKIEIVKLEKVSIGKGRSMNQYDIFAL